MDKKLTTVLITGAGKRLGRSMAKALDREGYTVVAHYNRSESEALSLVKELKNGKTVQGDLSIPEGARDVFHKASKAVGNIDILINNASIFPESTIMDFTNDDLHLNTTVNAYAPLVLSRELYRKNRQGAIINLLDATIDGFDRTHAAYHLSKKMLLAITEITAIEFSPLIRVNAIAPGLIIPPEGKGMDYLDRLKHTNPMNTHGNKQDINRALLFLLSSPFITGQTLYVDGGSHLLRG